jgi:hypothetical protein
MLNAVLTPVWNNGLPASIKLRSARQGCGVTFPLPKLPQFRLGLLFWAAHAAGFNRGLNTSRMLATVTASVRHDCTFPQSHHAPQSAGPCCLTRYDMDETLLDNRLA